MSKRVKPVRCGCGVKACMIMNGDHETGSAGCVFHRFGDGVPDWTPDVEEYEPREDKARDRERQSERRAKRMGWV